jgi:ABC-type taurine transport system ATPase subunit
MASERDIYQLPNGSRFYRADLHIHSYSASHDVSDRTMTPQAIVQTAIAERLDVIAIADHNEIGNVQAALAVADQTSLYVVPAIELSTPQGHLLCYLATFDALQSFFGRLNLADRGTPNSRCQTSILDCLQLLDGLKGVGILAHVDAPSGFETENAGNSPHKRDVLCHKALLGIELKSASSVISYADTDPDQDRANTGRERIARLKLGSKQFLSRVLNSDAHTLNALGRNAQGDTKVTRIKMHQPSFEALRMALQEGDARVRLEDQIPPNVPYVLGVNFDGGFLGGQTIHFSPNLNCIIGGRGTGKSTTFEAVRCLSGQSSDSDVVDSEIWPAQLDLFWRDQAEQVHALSRPLNGALENVNAPFDGPDAFHIDSYGQGETAKISRQAHNNPIALLSYLDRFIDIREASEREQQARDELLALQGQIEEATTKVNSIQEYERALSTTQQQLKALEQANAKEIIKLQRQIASEREVRAEVAKKLANIETGLESLSPKEAVDALAALITKEALTVGVKEFSSIVESARKFESQAIAAQGQAKASFKTFRDQAQTSLATWKSKEAAAQREIDDKRKALEAQNIRLDMGYIQKLANDEARQKQSVTNLKTWVPQLADRKRKRKAASQRRWAARERIATIRDAYAREASETLRSALSDLIVSLKFARSAYSPDAEQQIIEAMGWRTMQVPRAALLIEKLTMPGLLEAIDSKKAGAITAVQTAEGGKVFAKGDAESIIERLSVPSIRFALERCEVFDLPRLTVTKQLAEQGGKARYVHRDFSKLSLGQQQSVLLALMLSSNSNAPLIIDQPEDNLDSEFIYKSLVPVLRMAKEKRQIIVVTHNANIAVLGDAEQIIILRSTAERGTIVSRGSIDDPATREAACNILEGAREAFERRARIYGSL